MLSGRMHIGPLQSNNNKHIHTEIIQANIWLVRQHHPPSTVPVVGPWRCTDCSTLTGKFVAPFWQKKLKESMYNKVFIKYSMFACKTYMTHTWPGVSCRHRCGRWAGSRPTGEASAAGCEPEPWTQHVSPAQGSADPGSAVAPAPHEPAAAAPS